LQNHQAKRKGDAYGRGTVLQSWLLDADNDVAADAVLTVRVWRAWVRATKCHCGATDHVKTIFGGCELNPNNIAKEQKNLVNASTAMNDITKE